VIRLKHEYKGKEGYLMSVAEDVLEYLKEYHNSETKAIKSRGLCELFNLQNRQVRHLVSGLRQKGSPICSSNSGYWYSEDREDIDSTINRLSDQVRNMSLTIRGLRKAKGGYHK
jgi:hypothetical protein